MTEVDGQGAATARRRWKRTGLVAAGVLLMLLAIGALTGDPGADEVVNAANEVTTTEPLAPPTTAAPVPAETVSQANAREIAADHLGSTAFSRNGLIGQLQYEGFTHDDATYGVDALRVDWNEQASKMAADYLDHSSVSRSGLIEQLEYEGFTPAQAAHGVGTTGL